MWKLQEFRFWFRVIFFIAKLVPLAYGIKKLQITCVVEDDKVWIFFIYNLSCMSFECENMLPGYFGNQSMYHCSYVPFHDPSTTVLSLGCRK